jgi:ubiquinone/menaquinone biosynthesis C-methylase UbiE
MPEQDDQFKGIVEGNRRTRLSCCGFSDRFDPFRMSALPHVAAFYQDVFSELPKGAPYNRILDVGCGTGLYFEWLCALTKRLDGIEPSQEMLAVARKFVLARELQGVYLQEGTAESLPFDDETFDAVVVLDALHHTGDREGAIEEIRRVLKPGGLLLVLEPNIRSPLIAVMHFFHREERAALRANKPRRLRAFLASRFSERSWRGACQIVAELRGIRGLLAKIYLLFVRHSLSETWYPRQIWLGMKPPLSKPLASRRKKKRNR